MEFLDKFNKQILDLDDNDIIKNSYPKMIKEIDIIIMGSKTYNNILYFDIPWPYSELDSYVITNNKSSYKDSNIKDFLN